MSTATVRTDLLVSDIDGGDGERLRALRRRPTLTGAVTID